MVKTNRQKAYEMRQKKMTYKQIAAKLGVTKQRVEQYINGNRIKDEKTGKYYQKSPMGIPTTDKSTL